MDDLTIRQNVFLNSFLIEESDNIKNKDMTDPENLEEFIIKYQTYLENSEFADDPDMRLFLTELCNYLKNCSNKQPSEQEEQDVPYFSNNTLNLSAIMRRVRRNPLRPSICNNYIINGWYERSRIIYSVKKSELGELGQIIYAKTQRNAEEINSSWEEGKNYVVRN